MGTNGMLGTRMLGDALPIAGGLCHLQDGVQYLEIGSVSLKGRSVNFMWPLRMLEQSYAAVCFEYGSSMLCFYSFPLIVSC